MFVAISMLAGWFGLPAAAEAQPAYSFNIVGYINLPFYAGNNYIANQLANSDNTLNTIFQPGVPEGATFTKWDASLNQYLPVSTYDTTTGWSINYELTYGEGGLFNSPSTFINTFVGSVWPGFSPPGPLVPPLVTDNGLLLLSCVIPISNATFYDVVGRDPVNGEYVRTLDTLTQNESTTTFDHGVWDNGDPSLAQGQSAFFGLGSSPFRVSAVPEPSAGSLLGGGLLALTACRRFRWSR